MRVHAVRPFLPPFSPSPADLFPDEFYRTQMSLLALLACYDCARDTVRSLRKRLLLRVEDLVLDRDAAAGQATYERDGPPPRPPRVWVWHF